jgi:RND superfamily putative drug exporter
MRSRWAVRLVALAVLLVWLGVSGVGGPLVGRLSEVQKNDNASFLPAKAESTEVMNEVAKFSDTESLPFIIVMEGNGKVSTDQQAAVQRFVAALPGLTLDLPGEPTLADYLTEPPKVAIPSQDGSALLLVVPMDAVTSAETIGDTAPLFAAADALRAAAKTDLAPSGLTPYLTGPGGVTADFVTAFAGIDGILLVVALCVVFLILLVVYRSPILPIAVLLTAVFGLAAAALVVFPLAKNDVIGLSGQSQGILSILVVGAATDFALLLVSRY